MIHIITKEILLRGTIKWISNHHIGHGKGRFRVDQSHPKITDLETIGGVD